MKEEERRKKRITHNSYCCTYVPPAASPPQGSIWLLEMNPRFSGDIHTTLSNPGFLDLYFDVVFDRADVTAPVINFTQGTEMKADFGQVRMNV